MKNITGAGSTWSLPETTGAGSTWSLRRSTERVPTLDPSCCQFSFADGRRCRMPRWQAHPALCIAHARTGAGCTCSPPEKRPGCTCSSLRSKTECQLSAGDLAPLSGEFRTATDVNHVLGRLFSLLAQNRIPRRNAVALGYLAQLLLQTLPGVRDELTRCLGYEAWDETLESVFPEHKTNDLEDKSNTGAGCTCSLPETEDETNENETEAAERVWAPFGALPNSQDEADDEAESDQEAPLTRSDVEAASAGAGCTCSPRETNAPAHADAAIPQTDPQTENAPEPKPEELPEPEQSVAQMPANWSYWKELEQTGAGSTWSLPETTGAGSTWSPPLK